MAATPTGRTLEKLKKEGWLADTVERYIHQARVKRDLYGFIDILAVRGTDILGVQATSYSNVSARVKKILTHDNWPAIRQSPIRVAVWGWHKKNGRWTVRIVEVDYGNTDGSDPEQVAQADVRG